MASSNASNKRGAREVSRLALAARRCCRAVARPVAAQDDFARRLETADAAYRAAQFGDAARRYAALLDVDDAPRGALLLRLGNSEYRAENYGAALLAYERARLRIGGKTVEHNVDRARARLGIDAKQTPSPALPIGRLALLAFALQAAGLWWLLARQKRAIGMVLTACGLVCACVTGWNILTPAPAEALVVAARCDLQAEPHERASTILSLPTGTRVQVEEQSDRWARISHDRGTGWVRRATVGLID